MRFQIIMVRQPKTISSLTKRGRLTRAAKQVYEALLKEGALNTIDLRRIANLGNSKDLEFNRALEVLQADFKILPVGIADAGSWHYSFIYELVTRHYPDLPEKARRIGESRARKKLLELYLNSVGAAQQKIFYGCLVGDPI